MARKIYSIILVIATIGGVILYNVKDGMERNFLIASLFVVATLVVGSIHGIVAHSLRPKVKGDLIAYPIAMGALFVFLFWISLFFIVPLFCPNFI